MDELEALKASIVKQWGQIPVEISNEITALEAKIRSPFISPKEYEQDQKEAAEGISDNG
jgi:hypothetical protein